MDERLWMRRWKKAVFAAYLLRFLPYVRMVGLNGSMVTGKMHSGSDIDFFIVVKDGRIFTAKMIITALMQLCGVRRHGDDVAGQICLNRYAIESNLKVGEENRYHAEVFHNLVPLFSSRACYARYCAANAWMAGYGHPIVVHEAALRHGFISRFVQKAGEWTLAPFATRLEAACKRWQLARVAGDFRASHPGSNVVVSDQELRFHLAKEEYGPATTDLSFSR